MKLNEAFSFDMGDGVKWGDFSDIQVLGAKVVGTGILGINKFRKEMKEALYKRKLYRKFVEERLPTGMIDQKAPDIAEEVYLSETEEELNKIDRKINRFEQRMKQAFLEIDDFVEQKYDDAPSRFEPLIGYNEEKDKKKMKKELHGMLEHPVKFLQSISSGKRARIISKSK